MNKEEFKTAIVGQQPSASEHNKLTRRVASLTNSLHIQGLIDSSGLHTRRTPYYSSTPKIYEVQSNSAGDGVYVCFRQTVDAAEWMDTAGDSKIDDANAVGVEILNLAEFDPESTYVRHLAQYDLLVAWEVVDSTGVSRLVGIPFRRQNADRPRIAYCKTDAGAGTTIVCYLDTDGTGTEIPVVCFIAQGGAALNEAIPRLANGDGLMVTKVGAVWRCLTTFMASMDCDCYGA